MLVATDVVKAYGNVTALAGLTLHVGPGEVVCLLGSNGAGKTTTLDLFLGFLRPDGGTIRVGGVDPWSAPMKARQSLAYIPEQVALYENMSGLENLGFFDRLAGQSRSESKLLDHLETFGIERSRATDRVSTYSKGMRQKVGLSIATARDARALLLDEPMSGLDPLAAREFSGHLAEQKRVGRAILLTTHDIFRAVECATRIGIMKSGELVEIVDVDGVGADVIERIYLEHMDADVGVVGPV